MNETLLLHEAKSHSFHEHDNDSKTMLGFWIYIMTDCVLFATLFAAYAVLFKNTYGGPSGKDLFHLPFVLTETIILLTSSFTCGLLMLFSQQQKRKESLIWLCVTFLLGALFLGMEIHEFSKLIAEGNSWKVSAFLSAYFTLVGTHGFHILCGLLWALFLGWEISKKGITPNSIKRIGCFSMFWHFLDVVWIFIFTIVYLMGAR